MANDTKKQKKPQTFNPLEAIRDSGRAAADTFKEEVFKPMGKDFMNQILGRYPQKNYSGELRPGSSVEMGDVFSGKQGEKEKVEKQLVVERSLRQEEEVYVEKRMQELKIHIQAIQEEIIKIAEVTPELDREVKMAAIQAPTEPSLYALNFLEHILSFIKSFREKIENACVWLSLANKRAQKKNVWGSNYKKHGSKYLLSGEHYLTRSAG